MQPNVATAFHTLFINKSFLIHVNNLHFQNLLSENTVDDQHWPKELILLREKFTAKSQLEITQLNIKHADEVSIQWIEIVFSIHWIKIALMVLIMNMDCNTFPKNK